MENNNDEKRIENDLEKEIEMPKTSKGIKTFTKIQAIGLLAITLFLSTGGGFALGHFYFWNSTEMKRINEQLEYYQERVRINPTSLEDRIVLGYTYYLKGDNNRAVSEFNYVLDQDDEYYDAYYNLGLVYLSESKHYEALSMFNKTVQIAPRDFKGYTQLGITYRQLGSYDQAFEALSTANELNPANSDIIYQIGLVAEAMGDYEEAIEIYKDALAYDPLYEDALNALERLGEEDAENVGEENE